MVCLQKPTTPSVRQRVEGRGIRTKPCRRSALLERAISVTECNLSAGFLRKAFLDDATASQSEHLKPHSGARIQNPKYGEENYVHEEIIYRMSLQKRAENVGFGGRNKNRRYITRYWYLPLYTELLATANTLLGVAIVGRVSSEAPICLRTQMVLHGKTCNQRRTFRNNLYIIDDFEHENCDFYTCFGHVRPECLVTWSFYKRHNGFPAPTES
jgi:hypothetical protein